MSSLARPWLAWIAENLLRGATREDLAAGLVAGGLEPEAARAELDGVLRDRAFEGAQDGARRLLSRSAAVEQAARLRRHLERPSVLERAAIGEEDLWDHHWTAHRPLVLRGVASGWPAARWTAEGLTDRFGAVSVSVLRRGPGWWREERAAITVRTSFAALLTAPDGDEIYADGRARLLDEPGLAPLRADLGLLPGLVGDGQPAAWIGPAGTLTPTHHDQSTGWLVQLCGRKRLWLASPLEPALAAGAEGLFNTVDPRSPDGEASEVRWYVVDLDPGDAALIPVGWWHQVLALTRSISVSLGGFRWPNHFPWYLPGRP